MTAFLSEQGVGENQQHNATLVVDELAANAIDHASLEDDQVEITVTLEPQSLLVRILDPARTETAPVNRELDELSESGRGMLIVSALASWAERRQGGRREVTARLPLTL